MSATASIAARLEGKPLLPVFSLLVLYGMSIVLAIDSSIMGALVTPIKAEFHFTDEQIGRLQFAITIGSVALNPLFGPLGDRYARKPFMLIGIVIWSLATIGSGLAAGFAMLLIWRVLVGLGEGVYQSLWPSFISDIFGPRWRNVAFGVMSSTGPTGWCLGFLGAGVIAAAYSWHAAFFMAGVPGLILAVVALFLQEPRKGQADGHQAIERPSWHAGLKLFRNRDFLLYAVGSIMFLTVLGIMGSWASAFLHRTYGLTNRAATTFIGFCWLLFEAPGAYLGGLLGSYFKRHSSAAYAIQMGIVQALAGSFLFWALLTRDLAVSMNCFRAECFCLGLALSAHATLAVEVVPVSLRSNAMSIRILFGTPIAGLFASEVIGLISDRHGLGAALLVVGPSALAIGSCAWWMLTVFHLRDKSKARQRESASTEVLENTPVSVQPV